MRAADLRKLADAIPDLGHGGRELADLLIEAAARVPRGQSIVDIGPYLGSTTAYLALGARPGVVIHAYDTWDAGICGMREKARRYHGLDLPDDFLPLFERNLRPFGRTILVHVGDVRGATWGGAPIGLLVDDIGVDAEYTAAKMAAFGPSLVPGATLVLCDYYWHESKAGEVFRGQRRWFEAHRERYRLAGRAGEVAAVFEVRAA